MKSYSYSLVPRPQVLLAVQAILNTGRNGLVKMFWYNWALKQCKLGYTILLVRCYLCILAYTAKIFIEKKKKLDCCWSCGPAATGLSPNAGHLRSTKFSKAGRCSQWTGASPSNLGTLWLLISPLASSPDDIFFIWVTRLRFVLVVYGEEPSRRVRIPYSWKYCLGIVNLPNWQFCQNTATLNSLSLFLSPCDWSFVHLNLTMMQQHNLRIHSLHT